MGTIGSPKGGDRKAYTEITSEGRFPGMRAKAPNDGESEEYILNEHGRVIRQVVDVSVSESIAKRSEV